MNDASQTPFPDERNRAATYPSSVNLAAESNGSAPVLSADLLAVLEVLPLNWLVTDILGTVRQKSAGAGEIGIEVLEQVQDLEHAGYEFEAAEASFELLARRMLGNVPQPEQRRVRCHSKRSRQWHLASHQYSNLSWQFHRSKLDLNSH